MKMMKLLLTASVDDLGIVGDVISVKPGYARNFLLPRGLATDPTAANVKRLASKRAEVERHMLAEREHNEQLLTRLDGFEVTIMRSANEHGVLFGGVSQHDIAEALRAEGLPVDDRAIRIGEQIKRLDSYQIPIILAADLKTQIKVWVVSDKPAEELQADKPTDLADSGQDQLEPDAASAT